MNTLPHPSLNLNLFATYIPYVSKRCPPCVQTRTLGVIRASSLFTKPRQVYFLNISITCFSCHSLLPLIWTCLACTTAIAFLHPSYSHTIQHVVPWIFQGLSFLWVLEDATLSAWNVLLPLVWQTNLKSSLQPSLMSPRNLVAALNATCVLCMYSHYSNIWLYCNWTFVRPSLHYSEHFKGRGPVFSFLSSQCQAHQNISTWISHKHFKHDMFVEWINLLNTSFHLLYLKWGHFHHLWWQIFNHMSWLMEIHTY